ncbi:MAG: sulfotransferase [Deltaproteobacteria bacterium]|nr:MAG: sulfotransferase [Deltaproteobacteria bacterium]
MSDVVFDEERLLEEARRATGLSDFGPEDYRAGLRVLLETYDTNPLTETGRRRRYRRLLHLLTTRLRVQAALRRHPEIREREIAKPMVLTGLPRSGTSALFNRLAADPSARPLRMWETQFPDPLDGLAPGQPDPRREAIDARQAEARAKNPEFSKIHFTSADTPEECVLLHAYAMNGVQLGSEVMMEPYASWYRKQDLRGMYAYYRTLLQMLDWQRPGTRWLLKAPAHMWAIDVLIETFPDVSIVWSHRDPLLCTASICSMTHALMSGNVEVDPRALGPVVMDFYATSLERGLAARDRSDPARFIDVSHDAFVEDGLAVAERVYAHFQIPLASPARSAMRAQAQANPKGKHGAHEYRLEEYGLRAAQVRERFAAYIARFGIHLEEAS